MPEEFCEQCGQPLVPNARFCTACGWETGSQATLPLPQGAVGGYGGSGYQTQDYPQQGEPTPLEEFEQEFERQASYEPAYDPYSQYGNDSYGTADGYADGADGGTDGGQGNGRNSKGKSKRKDAKNKSDRKNTGASAAKSATRNSAKSKASAGKTGKSGSSRKHPATTAAIVILVCIVVVFSGIGIVRMMTSEHGTGSGSGSSTTTSSAASGNTRAGNGTANQSNQYSKQSGKSSATDTKSKKTKTKQQDAQPSAGGVYANARFGYAVTIPAGFTWNPEAANGDGRTFTNNQTGMTITAWGSNNALNATPESAFEQTTAGHQVAYQQVTDTEFTASWEENGTITYVREMVSAGAIRAIQFDYPSAQRNDCDRIVEQVVPTLTVTDSASASSGQ